MLWFYASSLNNSNLYFSIKIVSDLRVDGMTGKFGANGNAGYPNPFTAIIDPHHKIRHICEHSPHIGK